ncbi:MAG: radical SAM protein, partial [Candidatus Korarchaeota archaeon]|nr:radical SAM protein [Candidatus Korarchaeota archaeon]
KIRMASEQGIRMFKLYYMVGLPGEPRSIADEIAREVRVLRDAAGPGAVLKASVTPFIPKPHTPLQWAPMAPLTELREKIRGLGRTLRRAGISYSAYDPRWARIQAAISRGGRELGRLIARWGMLGGGLGAWRRALGELGMSEERLLSPPGLEEEPPWSIVDLGLSLEALRKGYEAYMEAAEECR